MVLSGEREQPKVCRRWEGDARGAPAPASLEPPLEREREAGLHTARESAVKVEKIFRLPNAVRRDPAVESWMKKHSGELGALARQWFDALRSCGTDVRELLHDGHPTACIHDAAFAYVNVFRSHVNVGFFRGAELPDPAELLEGTGKYMRHVKLRPDEEIDAGALHQLVDASYTDMKSHLM
jgi:hypothetical protein